MNTSAHAPDIEQLARRHAKVKIGWYFHACIYILVNLLLGGISALGDRHWAVYPALGWGLGLAIHGLAVLLVTHGQPLHERLVERERQRLMTQRDPW
jgi:hypothetical protein